MLQAGYPAHTGTGMQLGLYFRGQKIFLLVNANVQLFYYGFENMIKWKVGIHRISCWILDVAILISDYSKGWREKNSW